MAKATSKDQSILVTQTRSCIAVPEKLRLVVKALGLRGIGSSRVHKDNNCTRGMINKVRHLVSYKIQA